MLLMVESFFVLVIMNHLFVYIMYNTTSFYHVIINYPIQMNFSLAFYSFQVKPGLEYMFW